MAKSIADVMGRKLIRIPFGGLGDPLYLRGQSRLHPEAEPGAIIRGLAQCQTKNPVILLDEIDRVADDSLNTIMGILVELLDPEQNARFTDHYLDYPFDLSETFLWPPATTLIALLLPSWIVWKSFKCPLILMKKKSSLAAITFYPKLSKIPA